MRKVEVVPHQSRWADMFEEEKKKIKKVLQNQLIHLYHIGSTAIPNIKAKPVIDLLGEVGNIKSIDSFNQSMLEIGYEAKGENGIPGRRFFMKGGNNRTHHLHLFERGNDEIKRHLAFKEYMIAHPVEAKDYSRLKERLALQFPTDIDSYIQGKDAFIKKIDEKAKTWKNN
ncbi:GrpB-like predicted nucleotidyltransferase (UPF0157 family) [Salirhabdus euzebyi]|uniref:GrpB-like predicted nucleotidyltransferase (UPF0157 family) n=1 Tax=Salirhabdus euzebyi TaxID=394506 RepID=A0A841Q969_9BACI|nr:GrpB-like predicted nucleotidyltransferase (UPF0157 family) [Salirhabdus euzebyi]